MNGQELPNMTVVKGLIATGFGLFFIVLAYSIVVRMILFLAGLFLIYYGLQMLNISAVNNILNAIKIHVQKFLS